MRHGLLYNQWYFALNIHSTATGSFRHPPSRTVGLASRIEAPEKWRPSNWLIRVEIPPMLYEQNSRYFIKITFGKQNHSVRDKNKCITNRIIWTGGKNWYPFNGSLGGPHTIWRRQNCHVSVRIKTRNLQHTAKWTTLCPLHCKTVKKRTIY